jgi:adenine deaminase
MAGARTVFRFALEMYTLAHAVTTAMADPHEIQNGR